MFIEIRGLSKNFSLWTASLKIANLMIASLMILTL